MTLRVTEGHEACANFLVRSVADLLLYPAHLDQAAQQALLDEVEHVFTDADNLMLCKLPAKEEVKEVIWDSNQHAAPGTDGLTVFLYRQCWNVFGDPLTEVSQAIFKGNPPTSSQSTSLMVFGGKPKKLKSIK